MGTVTVSFNGKTHAVVQVPLEVITGDKSDSSTDMSNSLDAETDMEPSSTPSFNSAAIDTVALQNRLLGCDLVVKVLKKDPSKAKRVICKVTSKSGDTALLNIVG